jgi:hypothetical protein
MTLPGSDLERLHRAVLDAYDVPALEQLLQFKLSISLYEVVPTASGGNVVFKLLKQLDMDGRLGEFIAAVRADRSNKTGLIRVLDDLERKLRADEPAPQAGNVPVPKMNVSQEGKGSRSTRRKLVIAAAVALVLAGVIGLFKGCVFAPPPNGAPLPDGTLTIEVAHPAIHTYLRFGRLVLTYQDGKTSTVPSATKALPLRPGSYTIRIEDEPDLELDPPEFTLKGGDAVTVRIRFSDRGAAKRVLFLRGWVAVNIGHEPIKVANKLPLESFRLTGITLRELPDVTDAQLAFLQDCKNLKTLEISQCRSVSGEVLVHLKGHKNIETLWLAQNRNVGNKGLENLRGCDNLTHLCLAFMPVSDVGLDDIKTIPNLLSLDLTATRVTAKGFDSIKQLSKLTDLYLNELGIPQKDIADLAKALPRCWIRSDAGHFNPRK